MSSAALNFVLDNPNGAADHIEALEKYKRLHTADFVKLCLRLEQAQDRIRALEAALRKIIDATGKSGRTAEIARAALAPEPLPKTILDEPTSPPEQNK